MVDGLHLFRRYLSFARRTCIIFMRGKREARKRERRKVKLAVENVNGAKR